MCYSAWRFIAEFIRGDDRLQGLGLHLNAAQELSIVLFLAGVALWFVAPARTAPSHA
jgi:prolipoprotein diacylglyceryltransferase